MKRKNSRTGRCALFTSWFLLLTASAVSQPEPSEYFGFQPGSDRNLFNYEELTAYLTALDAASDRVRMVEIGKSPMGKTMYVAFLSSAANIAALEDLKEINRRLALDPELPEGEKREMLDRGKVFVLGTLSMHSSEVAPAQAAPLIAYDMATTDDPEKLKWMEDVVYMMVPNHNPDGMDLVVENYREFKGTKYEGSSLPGVYHKYVGHDNNRDFVTLSQEDTRAIARIYNLDWFPQVMVEKHQMGSTGPRYFVPPNHDPIAENVDAEIWAWAGVFGSNMLKDMTADSFFGVSTHNLFDDYWPGSTETCIWKNVIGMLTEAASVRTATPVYIEPNELTVSGKGLAEYKKSINMPHPWEGGWWHLSDIVDLELSSTFSILKTASNHRRDILAFRNKMAVKEVTKGRTQPPYYYVMPAKQHDPGELADLVNLLREHGIRVCSTGREVVIGGSVIGEGSVVIPLAQPFRAFIKEVMEVQEYPVRHYTEDGPLIKPYDITTWSLPLHMGVESREIHQRSEELESSLLEIKGEFGLPGTESSGPIAVFPVCRNESFKAAFRALGMGLTVGRMTEDVNLEGVPVRKGSFVISAGNKGGSLQSLVREMGNEPLYTASVPGTVETLTMPRIALVETNFHDMDAGWTRFVLDTYHIPFKVLKPGDFEETDFAGQFDVVVFPGARKSILMEGSYGSGDRYRMVLPPQFAKGIGEKGMEKLMAFIDKGGTVISWEGSTELFQGKLSIPSGKKKETDKEPEKEDFGLPFSDVSEPLARKGLYCPGSLVKINLLKDHPLTLGMPGSVGVFYRGKPVFQTSLPGFDMDRRAIGVTPEKDILLSGYMEKEELLGNKSLMVWMKKGEGQFVLFAFNPNFRASTHATYKLLFNSLLL